MQIATELALPHLAIEPEWKTQTRLWGHSFHRMCSYLASFPASMAHASISTGIAPSAVITSAMSRTFAARAAVPIAFRSLRAPVLLSLPVTNAA